MTSRAANEPLTFWQHLEVLRAVVWRSLIAVVIGSVAVFVAKEWLFRVVLAPCRGSDFTVGLINTELAGQFQAHLTLSLEGGLLLASPYVLWQMFGFVAPALYARERRFALVFLPAGYALFLLGVLFNYFLLFPVALRFLATYEVSPEVQNAITLTSYLSTFTTMTLALGLVFELPIVVWLLGRFGLVSGTQLRRYRRHALVALMLLAALVTPPDAFTMFIVSIPLYLLYEVSIHIIKR